METGRVSAVLVREGKRATMKRRGDRENGGERAIKTKLWLFARFLPPPPLVMDKTIINSAGELFGLFRKY